MKKREADFQTVFGHWVTAVFLKKKNFFAAPYEVKHSHGKDYISFEAVKEHQVDWLMAATGNKGINYKISDQSAGFKPFDGFMMKNMPAYVVFRYPGFFCLIDIQTFVLERDRSARKSLTSARAKEISNIIVDLK